MNRRTDHQTVAGLHPIQRGVDQIILEDAAAFAVLAQPPQPMQPRTARLPIHSVSVSTPLSSSALATSQSAV